MVPPSELSASHRSCEEKKKPEEAVVSTAAEGATRATINFPGRPRRPDDGGGGEERDVASKLTSAFFLPEPRYV